MQAIKLSHIQKSYGEKDILNIKELLILPNSKVGIIGKNGSGKSTLLRVVYESLKKYDIRVGFFKQMNEYIDKSGGETIA